MENRELHGDGPQYISINPNDAAFAKKLAGGEVLYKHFGEWKVVKGFSISREGICHINLGIGWIYLDGNPRCNFFVKAPSGKAEVKPPLITRFAQLLRNLIDVT